MIKVDPLVPDVLDSLVSRLKLQPQTQTWDVASPKQSCVNMESELAAAREDIHGPWKTMRQATGHLF